MHIYADEQGGEGKELGPKSVAEKLWKCSSRERP